MFGDSDRFSPQVRKLLSCCRGNDVLSYILFVHTNSSVGRIHLTSILRLDGDDALPLGAEALRGSSLDFKLVGNILGQVWDGQTGLGAVAIHLEGTHVSWRKDKKQVRKYNTFTGFWENAQNQTSQ